MTAEYNVQVTLFDGGRVQAESMDEAVEEALNKSWNSSKATALHIEDPETGEEREVQVR